MLSGLGFCYITHTPTDTGSGMTYVYAAQKGTGDWSKMPLAHAAACLSLMFGSNAMRYLEALVSIKFTYFTYQSVCLPVSQPSFKLTLTLMLTLPLPLPPPTAMLLDLT